MNRPYVWRRDFIAAKFIERRILEEAHGRPGFVFAGRTDEAIRKTRIREAIVELGIADNIIGTVAGKPETFRQCFERHYREPLRLPVSA